MNKKITPAILYGGELLEFIENLTDEVDWLAEGLLTDPSITMIYATDGIGKSLVGVQAALELASGLPVFKSFHPVKPYKVIYVMAERSIKEPMKRIKRMMAEEAFKLTFKPENFLITTTFQGKDLSKPEMGAILLQHVKDLADTIGGADVVFFDPLYALVRGDLKSDEAINSVFNFFRSVGSETGASIVFIHHENRGSRNEGALERTGQDFYGNKFISGLCTAVWHMVKVGKKEDMRTALVNEKDTESALPPKITLEYDPVIGTVKADINHNKKAKEIIIDAFLAKMAGSRSTFNSDDFSNATGIHVHPVSMRRLLSKLSKDGRIRNVSEVGSKAVYSAVGGL
jgi:RecA-family ATPase